ncbi:hypothetical protein J1614_010912 [Plenodomus biglobosus]|nr:hypothetical protein J1614_010912 [Plenodomus biglobosus]
MNLRLLLNTSKSSLAAEQLEMGATFSGSVPSIPPEIQDYTLDVVQKVLYKFCQSQSGQATHTPVHPDSDEFFTQSLLQPTLNHLLYGTSQTISESARYANEAAIWEVSARTRLGSTQLAVRHGA